mmetsp:Transcript_3258/g.6105  ORF Transcript_3258/g.6105 Transcript_3258/m.6105 type:complete len:81 (+) Transcript_3258:444-686(+)
MHPLMTRDRNDLYKSPNCCAVWSLEIVLIQSVIHVVYNDVHCEMICNNEYETFGVIPKSKQQTIQFLHIPKTGGESLEKK